MTKINQNKKKTREPRRTLLLYCEGSHEKVFLGYLKMLFSKNSGVQVRVRENHGGSADDVLANVVKQTPADVVVCIYDLDRGFNQELKTKVKNMGIICIENMPCLEAFLLNILEEKDYSRCGSGDCKKIFHNNYLDEKRRKDKRNYAKIFPKRLLIKQSKRLKNLKILIDLICGN